MTGHGSGKLFQPEDLPQLATVVNPLTGKLGDLTCYSPDTTWSSTFGKIASNYEGISPCVDNIAFILIWLISL